MIDKLIKLLVYLGVTFLSGYMMWEISSVSGPLACALAIGAFLGTVVVNFKNKDNQNFVQYFGLIGAHFGGMAVYKGLELIPNYSQLIFDLKLVASAALTFAYFSLFHKHIAKAKFYAILKVLSLISLIVSLSNLVYEYLNMNLVVTVVALVGLWQSHKIQLNKKSFLDLLISRKSELTTADKRKYSLNYDPVSLSMLNGACVIALLWVSFPSSSLGDTLYYFATTVVLGTFWVFNTRSKSIVLGFWVSISLMIYNLYYVLDLSRSMTVLVAGIGCLALALMLKKIKDNPSLSNEVRDALIKGLSKYEVKDIVYEPNAEQ